MSLFSRRGFLAATVPLATTSAKGEKGGRTMTQNPSLPNPHEWHTSKTKPCPICGLVTYVGSAGHKWEHRRLKPAEKRNRTYAVRSKSSQQRVPFYLLANGHRAKHFRRKPLAKNVGNRTELRGKRGHFGPTAKTKDRIIRATTLLANGKSRPEVAELLKVQVQALYDYQFSYPGLWQQSYDAAMIAVRDTVRQLADTNAIPEDLQAFLLAGIRADQWSRARGEQLFDHGDKLTLPLFYERHYLPLRPASPPTVYFDRIILRRWALLTGDPPLTEISAEHLCRFRDLLSKMRGLKSVGYMSPNTISGYMKKLQTFLDKAGPPGQRNRDALGLVDKVPWVKPPRGIRRVVRIVSEETLNNFYLGCIAAKRPRWPDIKPAAWWRALIVLAYNSGLRRGTLFKIRLSWINWERRCITIPPQFTKTGQEQIIPMNAVVFDHLNAIRGDREYLFRFSKSIEQGRWFYTNFHRLQDACGIPRDQHFGLHQLRKTCATVLWEHNPQVAQFALGHTSMETTATFYVRGQAMLERAVEQMPQPSAFGSLKA